MPDISNISVSVPNLTLCAGAMQAISKWHAQAAGGSWDKVEVGCDGGAYSKWKDRSQRLHVWLCILTLCIHFPEHHLLIP